MTEPGVTKSALMLHLSGRVYSCDFLSTSHPGEGHVSSALAQPASPYISVHGVLSQTSALPSTCACPCPPQGCSISHFQARFHMAACSRDIRPGTSPSPSCRRVFLTRPPMYHTHYQTFPLEILRAEISLRLPVPPPLTSDMSRCLGLTVPPPQYQYY